MTTSGSPVLESRTAQKAGEPLRLNLGGAGEGFMDSRLPGFLTVDLRKGPQTDLVADASCLAMFEDGSVDEIYASNILEHFPHRETVKALKEWRRVLKKGGTLWVSVPDFGAAVELFKREGLTEWICFLLWGDQKHPLNFHYINFTYPTLAKALMDANFSDCKKLDFFPFEVEDASTLVDNKHGIKISLNAKAIA